MNRSQVDYLPVFGISILPIITSNREIRTSTERGKSTIMHRNSAIIFATCLLLANALQIANGALSRCYPDYCHNTTNFVSEATGDLCLIQPVSRGQECLDLKFDSLGHIPAIGDTLAKVSLTAYVKDFGDIKGKATAFNLTVDDVNFHKLVTRYQNLAYPESSACRRVEFYGNLTTSPFKEFHVSCPFSNNSFELSPYRLEYLISSNNYEYSRKFVFIVPRHRFIDDSVQNVTFYSPFIYVDVSDSTVLTLYIQALPRRFSVPFYKVWMINRNTNSTFEIVLEDFKVEQHIKYTFTVHDGIYYFKVAALHPVCGDYGCVNSTSPLISIKQSSNPLLIMIISIIWIPPVILFAVYHFYRIYKRKEMLKRFEKKPKCLLIYSPTHMSHVNVMIDLARYLRSCNIFAMIDTLDISESDNKDPLIWCSDAFHSAEVVVVATSPPNNNDIAPVIYRNMDAQALRLLRENYPKDSRRYYALQFPYCRKKDIPKEAKHFKRFIMPDELNKLVKAIHQTDYLPQFFDLSSRDFLESIKLAMMQIIPLEKKIKTTKAQEELLLPELEFESTNGEIFPLKEIKPKTEHFNGSGNTKPQKSYKTNIEELNLLGETNETDSVEYNVSASTSQLGFRVDSLKL